MHLLVLTTCPNQESAQAIAATLVKRGLAACVNILPGVQSVYVWKGETVTEQEMLLLIKSRKDIYPAVEQAIVADHPYELPEVVAVPIEAGLPDYLSWIDELLDARQ